MASPPISLRLPAGQAGVVEHDSGARIEVPRGATEERVTVSIEEVKPPPSPLEVRRAFDFSVGGAELVGPVTVHIPFELEPGQDASSVRALHWDEEGGAWEPVPGLVDESAGTIAVATDRLRLFSSLWVEVEASCAASPGEVEAGETLRVISTGTSFTLGTIGIYMAPSVTRAGGGVVVTDGSSARTEVTTVGWDDSWKLVESLPRAGHGVEPETVSVNGNGHADLFGIRPTVKLVPANGHANSLPCTGYGGNGYHDEAPEPQQSLFSWAEFMAEEPVKLKGRSLRPQNYYPDLIDSHD